MSKHAAILFANDAFYLAFATRDVEAMDAVWAKGSPASCIHPGWNMITGRAEVMRSWQAILESPDSPDIQCRHAKASLSGDFAYVVCYEELEGGFLVATNIYVRENGAWKMVHHQAGATGRPIEVEMAEDADRIQ